MATERKTLRKEGFKTGLKQAMRNVKDKDKVTLSRHYVSTSPFTGAVMCGIDCKL